MDLNDNRLTLADGRTLAFSDQGDPSGYPLVFGHGMPGCRLEGAFLHDQAQKHGFRILTPDRPGIGGSSFQVGRTLLDYPDDIAELLNALGIERFSHVGWSSGASRTLACGYRLGQRMELGVCLSGYTHFAEYHGTHHLIESTRWPGPRLARFSPGLLRLVVGLVTWLSRRHPGLYLREARHLVNEDDQRLLAHLQREGHFRQDQLACLNSGGRAIAADLLTELGHWQFALRDVKRPIWVYQGDEDSFIPIDYAQHLVDHLPDSQMTLLPRTGHLYPLSKNFQSQLFRRLQSHLA